MRHVNVLAEEFRERQGRARNAAASRNLDALLAFSRGTPDRFADAFWLTGLATSQPFVPDLAGHWRAAGHVAVVVPVDGPVTAIVESEELSDVAVADEVVVAVDVVAAVAAAMSRCGCRRAGVLAADALPFAVVLSSGPGSMALGPAGGAAGTAGWTTRRLVAGDLLRIDAYGSAGAYLFDFARTVVVGGEASDEQAALIDALRDAVRAGIDALRPGVALGDVARAAEDALADSEHARRHGAPEHLMGGFWGHGLGLGFEPPWIGPDSAEVVEPGWCLAVERRAAVPGLGGAQYEDDVLITPDGAERLTGRT